MLSSVNGQLALQLGGLAITAEGGPGVTTQRCDPSLGGMPSEILLKVLEDPVFNTGDLAAFAATNKLYNAVATNILYERHIMEEDGIAGE